MLINIFELQIANKNYNFFLSITQKL